MVFPVGQAAVFPCLQHVPLWEPGALRINFGKGWVHPLGIREPEGGRGGGKEKAREAGREEETLYAVSAPRVQQESSQLRGTPELEDPPPGV